MNIAYQMPTKVIMGEGCVRANAALIAGMGNKALIVTGARSAKANGSQYDAIAALTQNGQSYAVYDKVTSNPAIACAYDGAAFAKAQGCDFVIAIGGGSPMDAAKAIALLARQDIPEPVLFSGQYNPDVLPMVHIPTTAGTGSEVTPYAILTNHTAQTKMSLASPLLFPKIALLDAGYMSTLSLDVTVNTAIDALSHAVEGMLTVRANVMTDIMAAEAIRNIAFCIGALKQNALTPDIREKLLYASMLGGTVIANTGTTVVHAMGYPLTYFKNIDHGRANGLLMAAFFDFLQKRVPEKVSEILSLMGFISVEAFKSTLNELMREKETVTGRESVEFAEIVIKAKNVGNTIIPPSKNDIVGMYKASF
jgi:alcohol dehydrogenase class IV